MILVYKLDYIWDRIQYNPIKNNSKRVIEWTSCNMTVIITNNLSLVVKCAKQTYVLKAEFY